MKNSEKPVIEIETTTTLNFIDRLYESLVVHLNKGEFFISNESNTSITLKNKNFGKSILIILGVNIVILAAILLIAYGIAINASTEFGNKIYKAIGIPVLLVIYFGVKSIWTLNKKVIFRSKKIYSTNLIGMRKILISSDQKFVVIHQSGVSFLNEANRSNGKDVISSDNSIDEIGEINAHNFNDRKNHNVISFRNERRQIESMNLMILYDPEKKSSQNIALKLVAFIQKNYPACNYVDESSENSI